MKQIITYKLKILGRFLFGTMFFFNVDCQIQISNPSVANMLNSQFTSMGVSISNMTVNGNPIDEFYTVSNISYFTNGQNPNFPLSSGILLTTGNGQGAVGPNGAGGHSNNTPPTSSVSSDPHLNSIANGTVTNGVVLEFDFIAAGDSISFNYIFGSEEYPEFSPSSFNDAFGFFIWGPGITGPHVLSGYPDGGINMAVIPGTYTPVTINNVGPGAGQNPTYYVNNQNGAAYGTAIQYDGTTISLQASNILICGQTYHIKMALGNVADQGWDSGVFLEESSFITTSTSSCGAIFGSVYYDYNSNCIRDFLDSGQENYTIAVEPGGFVATTGPGGFWFLDDLEYGTYTATIDTTNLNWELTCPISQVFQYTQSSASGPMIGPSFGLINSNPCTDPSVTIYAPFLRPCLPDQMIYILACNQVLGTDLLGASYVDVALDPLITVTGSSIPFSVQGNNVYRFQTGDLYPGQCLNFTISALISSPTVGCASLLGHTLCMEATLYPIESCVLDTVPSDPPAGGGGSGGTLNELPQPCTLPWDQSSLSVDGWCANDSIYFTITNTGEPGGGNMECYSPMWITVDGVVTYTDSIMIAGGETMTLSFPGDGLTWILNASQHPLHPGNSQPNAHVEACGSDITNWTPDLVNDFPQDDADPVVDIYCGVVTGSYDPNDKTGYPNGVTDQYYIQPNQQLQYVIRFQNTGTDTAFTVVIRDTLDTDLNIFTVTPGVSSHNYEFRMYGPRVLEWTFNNILLPDSTTNEPESNGFVTFHVEQVPDLAPGTDITNDADIYFDFNEPITTNTTMHRIYEGFVNVATLDELSKEKSRILVYPNPSNGIITVVLKDKDNSNYDIYDQMGRMVKSGSLDEKKTNIQLDLKNGMYYLKVGNAVVKVNIQQ
jgi:uncharacterized repeat protein (TIGR01451 family)